MPNKGLNGACILGIGKGDHYEWTAQVNSPLLALDNFQAILTPEIPEGLTANEALGHCARLKLFKKT
jgi:hypothetical protein